MTIAQKIKQFERLAELAELDPTDEETAEFNAWFQTIRHSQPRLALSIDRAETCDLPYGLDY